MITKSRNLIGFFFSHMFAGRPGTDYPILSAVPYTNFYCDEQLYPGFFADMETRCQGERVRFGFASTFELIIDFFFSPCHQDGTIVVRKAIQKL